MNDEEKDYDNKRQYEEDVKPIDQEENSDEELNAD
jgi:hypothetical protein